MNPYLVGQLAACHLRDLRRTAAMRAVVHAVDDMDPGPSRQAAVPGRRLRALRYRLGFAMIEAGLRLATDITDASGTAGGYLNP